MKRYMKLLVAAIFVLVAAGLLAGCSAVAHLTQDGGPGMEDPNGPMLEFLSDYWISSDGRWTATINGFDLKLFLEGSQVYDGNFSFSAQSEDINAKTELTPYYNQLQNVDVGLGGTIESLYTENGLLYLSVVLDGSDAESVTMEKEEPQLLDGDRTYVDNQALFEVIEGSWTSDDGRWNLIISGEAYDARVELFLSGESVLESMLEYTYLLPNPFSATELCPASRECQKAEDAVFAEIASFTHEAGDGDGALYMELTDEQGDETVTFHKGDVSP